MADKTATQNLTRPQSTDSQRDQWFYLKTLAGEVDQRMTAQWYDVGRLQNPPLCVLRLNTPVLLDISGGQSLIFDTVDQDTGGLADPGGSRILLTEAGYWEVGFYIRCTGLGLGTAADIQGTFSAPSSSIGENRRDGSVEDVGIPFYTTILSQTPSSDSLSVALGYNGAGGAHGTITTVTYAEMWACKVRDL